MLNFADAGAFPSFDLAGNAQIHFGLYLPGIRQSDGFSVTVRTIHREDRFDPSVATQNADLAWTTGTAVDFWSATVQLANPASARSGGEGEYLYRFELWHSKDGNRRLVSAAVPDPFARASEIGLMSAVTVSRTPAQFAWNDGAYRTPELRDLIVYELQVEEFNDTFDGVIDRLDYIQSLGVNCLELMPVTSAKLDFDWGYGPVFHFAPHRRFGGGEGLKRLVNAAHQRGIAVILDVVCEHIAEEFAYVRVYQDLTRIPDAPHPPSPFTKAKNRWGFGPACDFTSEFTRDFFFEASRAWLDEYHVDGFRFDEVTDLYVDDRKDGYRELMERIYRHSLTIPRFQHAGSYSRLIQCAETLDKDRSTEIMQQTWTNGAWTNDLLNKAADMIRFNYVNDDIAHILDPLFLGYPATQTVVDAADAPVERPVAPFQYLESHDHSPLIVSAGTVPDSGPLPEGNRDLFYKLQPYAIGLYTCQGVPMLWQGQEFADNYNLPDNGFARIHLRRDTHWEFFYDASGQALIRLYRRLGTLRRSSRALRGTGSFYYFQQSHQGNQVIAYHRHDPGTLTDPEQWAMVLLNFGDSAATITVPFPAVGVWREMLDSDHLSWTISISSVGENATIEVPSHYGLVFVL